MELAVHLGNKNYIRNKVYYLGVMNLLRSQSLSLKNHQTIKSQESEDHDWQNDRIRTKKGIWMKRRIGRIHKAEPARQKVQKKILVVMAHRALFLVWGE